MVGSTPLIQSFGLEFLSNIWFSPDHKKQACPSADRVMVRNGGTYTEELNEITQGMGNSQSWFGMFSSAVNVYVRSSGLKTDINLLLLFCDGKTIGRQLVEEVISSQTMHDEYQMPVVEQ